MQNVYRLESTGNVVRDYFEGHTHVVICDDYCKGQKKEEAEAVFEKIASKLMPYLISKEKTGVNPSNI